MHQYPLINDDQSEDLTNKFLEALIDIYNRHDKDDKLDINNFKEYFNHAMNHDLKDTALEKKHVKASLNMIAKIRGIGPWMTLSCFMEMPSKKISILYMSI